MFYNIEYAYASNIGKVRRNHEDNFWCDGNFLPYVNSGLDGIKTGLISCEAVPAFAVFDGMGGESCGEIASGLAAEVFDEYYTGHKYEFSGDPERFIEKLSHEMNRRICEYAHTNHIGSMGSTSAMAIFGDDWYAVSNLGDSRIYACSSGKLRQLSTDHVFGGGVYRKAPLVQYLGLEETDAALKPSFVKEQLTHGLRLLLCSDGVTDMIDDTKLREILSGQGSVEETAGVIIETALDSGGRDNTTVILIEVRAEGAVETGPGGSMMNREAGTETEAGDSAANREGGFRGWLRSLFGRR